MLAPLSWSASGDGVIFVEGTFDGSAARQLAIMLRHLGAACVIDFSHAHDVQLHALGALLMSLYSLWPRDVTVRGWTEYHVFVVESFGFCLDDRGRLLRNG